MKKFNITLILVLCINLINAQNPLVKQWDYRFGGSMDETFTALKQTADGGFIIGGHTRSPNNGDVTEPNRDSLTNSWDYWIVKTDSQGIKQWDKRFGGTKDDNLSSVLQTNDGGYILGGSSRSGIGGDKTQSNWDTTFQTYDFWIVKTDALGNKIWDKRFGGSKFDYLMSLSKTPDGGYLLGGGSYSGINGDKSEANWDTITNSGDFWVVKIDSGGIKQWDKRFGGNGDDGLMSLTLTCDGGFILGGFTYSDSSGDKTQNSWHNAVGNPSLDYWIVKINSVGFKEWDKRFGGTLNDNFASINQSSDGGYIFGGYSHSAISGDKTQDNWGGSDLWIVKTDSLGIKQWDKRFGGIAYEDEFGNITQTCDGGYLLAGTSYSNISGDKTESNMASEQTWVLKIDSVGTKQWDKTLLTNSASDDETGFAIEIQNGSYVMANYTRAGIGGDKTQSSQGASDYWFIKFSDTTYVPCTPILPCNSTVGISTNYFIPELLIYPNPFSTNVSISIKKQNIKQVSILIRNILGQTVFRKEENNLTNTYTKTIDLNKLANGIYLLDVIIDEERTVKRIVKQ